MIKLIHPIAGSVSMFLIALFWTSTLVAELVGDVVWITIVKTTIPYGLLLLIPMLMTVAGTVQAKGRRGGVLGPKARRMPVIAANGLLVLVPSALFLAWKAQHGAFDTGFYIVQSIELTAGAINLSLMALSLRDGLRLRRAMRSPPLRA